MVLEFMFKKCFMTFLIVLSEAQTYNGVNIDVQNLISISINSTVNPCDDFYAYACGNYAEQHRSKYYQEMTSLMDFQYNVNILNLLETCYQHDYQVHDQCQSFVEKTRIYFKACRSESKRNLTRYFEDIKPGPQLNWPIWQKTTKRFENEFKQSFDIWKLLGELQSYGLNNALINQEISLERNGEFSITLEPAYSESNSTLPDSDIIQVLLMGLGVVEPKKILNDLYETDSLMLEILEKFIDLNEATEELTYERLKLNYPNLNLAGFLNELLKQNLPADTEILLKNPKYFQYLNDNMVEKFRQPEFGNYLMMKFLFYLAKDSTAEFKKIDCVKDLRNKMDLAVNFLYYSHKYQFKAEDYNKIVNDMFTNIKQIFHTLFESNRLNLTEIQIKFLQDKLQKMRLNIGNLPEDVTREKVQKFYENVPGLDKNNYYKNHLLLLKHRFQNSLQYAQNQTYFIVNDNHLGSSSGPFYVIKQNMIILPFGSLEYPLFDAHFADVYKYSLLGFILAHEVTHAFDTTGLNFDDMGELIDASDILDNINFENSLNCLQFQLPTDSIDERMADIVGINVIFKIFSKMHHLYRIPDKMLQNFYLNLAQFFCGKSNVQFIDHDTDAQRLHQIVMNSEGFAYAFQCAGNSKMNPSKKCRLY